MRVFICFFIFVSAGALADGVGISVGGKFYVNAEHREKFWENHRELEPIYSELDIRKKRTACVTVMFKIGSNGKTYDASVVRIHPRDYGRFRKNSLKAVKKFRFKPAADNQRRKEIITTHTFKYIASTEPTKKAHREMLAKLEEEFKDACEVVFERPSSK